MIEPPTLPAVSIWSYEGRSSRTDYFVVLLITSILGAIAGTIMVKGGALGFISGLFFAGVLWVSLCACARRLHDLGHSGWWSLAVLLPLVNFFFGLYILFAPGQQQDNEYGRSPTTVPPSTLTLPSQVTSAPTPVPPHAPIHKPAVVPAAVNPKLITIVPPAPEVPSAEPMEEFWAQALHECESAAMKAGLWAKAFSAEGGDERMAKATYMRLRAAQLQGLYEEEQQTLKLAHEQELQAELEKQKAQEAEVAELLAKMNEIKRAEALLPKGKCPSCGDVIPLISEQCPKCTALFTADSKWKVKPLSKYEALVQRSEDDAVIQATRSKEEEESDSVRHIVAALAVFVFVLMVVLNSQ